MRPYRPAIDFDQVSIVTASDATEDNQRGAGRTLGVLLTVGGMWIERAITRLADRLGRSPNAKLSRMLRLAPEKWIVPHRCRHLATADQVRRQLRSGQSLEQIVPWLLQSGYMTCTFCRPQFVAILLADKRARKACKQLVAWIRGTNLSARYLALQYITTLVALDDAFRVLFLRLELEAALLAMIAELDSMFRLTGHEDALLFHARRALVSVSESDAFKIIKDFEALTPAFEDIGFQLYRGQRDEFENLSSFVGDRWSALVRQSRDPVTSIISLRSLSTFLNHNSSIWITSVLVSSLTPAYLGGLLQDLVVSSDPVYRAVVTEFVLDLYETVSYHAAYSGPEVAGTVWTRMFAPLFDMRRVNYPAYPTSDRVVLAAVAVSFGRLTRLLPAQTFQGICNVHHVARNSLNSVGTMVEIADDATFPMVQAINAQLRMDCYGRLYRIPREIPAGRRYMLANQLADIVKRVPFSKAVVRNLRNALPIYAERLRNDLWRITKSSFEDNRRRHDSTRDFLNYLYKDTEQHRLLLADMDAGQYPLCCTGITTGSITTSIGGVAVYDDHWCTPLPMQRQYRKDELYAHLLAHDFGRYHLRWLPILGMDRSWTPIPVLTHRHLYIGRLRCASGKDINEGKLLLLDEDFTPLETPWHQSLEDAETGLHILVARAQDAPVYWATPFRIFHAITGDEAPAFLLQEVSDPQGLRRQ